MSVLGTGETFMLASGEDAGYKIERSLRFNSGDSAYLNRTPSSAGNRKTWTWSAWVKRAKLGTWQMLLSAGSNNSNRTFIAFVGSDTPTYVDQITIGNVAGGVVTGSVYLNPKLRDLSAWYHIVIKADLTDSTANNRVKGYINGVEVDVTVANAYENVDTQMNNTVVHQTKNSGGSSEFIDGYLAEVNFLDGTSVSDASDFGELDADTGVWNPKEYTGSYNAAAVGLGGVTWSSYVSGSVDSTYPLSKCFGGTIGTGYNNGTRSTNPGTLTLNITALNLTVTNVRLNTYLAGSPTLTINGTDVSISGSGNQTHVVAVNGQLNLVAWSYNSGNGPYCYMRGIEVDLGDGNGYQLLTDGAGAPAGTNGFHLDFSDNSSNAALGFDARVSDTRYSLDAYFGSSGSTINTALTAAFDGSTATAPNKTNADTFTWAPSGGYAYTSSVEVYLSSGIGTNEVTFNGTTATTGTGNRWATLATGSGTITNITTSRGSTSNAVGFSAVRVDGTILTDPAGANDWTVNNLAFSSFDAVGNSSHVGPGTLTNLSTNSSYNLIDVGSNQVSSNPGSAALVRFNFSALGLTAPATITFDSYEQGGGGWSNVSTNIYTDAGTVTASTTASGNIRSNTVSIPSGATYFEIPGSYNAQYQLYYNGIKNLVWDGVSYQHLGPEAIDSLIDTPTNYEASSGNNGGNYCTWNPLSTNSTPTFSEGNLTVTNSGSGSSGWRNIASTMAVSSGKWYMEFQTAGSMNGGLFIGIQKVPEDNDQFNPASFSNNFVGMTANSYSLNAFSGNKRTNGSDSSYGSGQALNDILMMAVDLDNGKIWWGKNGTWFASGDPDSGTNAAFTGLSGTFVFAVGISASEKIHSNWGQRPFAYSNNISGFKSVCTQNLDDPTIADGSTAFDAITYNGATQSPRTITGLSFEPDFVWVKNRSISAGHYLWDAVRGTDKNLRSDDTFNESSVSGASNGIISTNASDGFVVKNGSSSGSNVGSSGSNAYVAWTWDGGDLATNSAYNQSAVWSNSLTSSGSFPANNGAPTAFDGSTSTLCQSNANSETLTFAPSGGIAYSTSVEVYTYASHGQFTTTSDGAQTVSWTSTYQGWKTIASGGGTFTSTVLNSTSTGTNTSRPTIAAIRVDGKILVDAGVIPAGSLNSSVYNQSQTWSAGTTSGAATLSGNGFDKMFNGQYGSAGQTQSSGNAILTFTSPISFNKDTGDTLELIYWQTFYVYTSAGTVTLNGGSTATNSFRDVTSSLPSGSITITGIGVNVARGMRISNKPIIDSGVSVTNVPSIASTCRANQAAGFSIVTATQGSGDSTWGHGLNAKPDWIVLKARNQSYGWFVSHSGLDNQSTKFLQLHNTNGVTTNANWFASTEPTGSVITTKAGGMWNSSDNFVAYCWTAVEGYSAFGTYTGNGNATIKPYINVGFRPAFILIKATDISGKSWLIYDKSRDGYNRNNDDLAPDLSNQENDVVGSSNSIDIFSNGFQPISDNSRLNQSGATYLYCCFAEHPFKTARAR